MTPGARAAAAIELLNAVEADRSRPADSLVANWFRKRRYAGSGDRRAIQAVLYTVLRRRAQLDWWLENAGCDAASRSRVVAALVLGDGWTLSDFESAFDGGRYRPSPLSAVERHLAGVLADREFDDPSQPVHVRGNVPAWIAEKLVTALGDELESELRALMDEAPVDLRINSLKTTREEVARMLAAGGVESVPTRFSPVGLRLAGRANLADSPVLRDGLAEVQDESSQIAALLADARPGGRVVDFCAGAGGKTLALAATMQDRGCLVACDISGARLERALPRLERAGVTTAKTRKLDAPDGLWPDAEQAAYDCVFVDAPCSGTGTWRRRPEGRWRIGQEDLARFTALQGGILASASRLVRPGGRLLYSVCSLLPDEAEGVVAGFMANFPDFGMLPVRKAWAGKFGADCPADDVFLRLRPGRDGTDGFFVALLERGGGTSPPVPVQ